MGDLKLILFYYIIIITLKAIHLKSSEISSSSLSCISSKHFQPIYEFEPQKIFVSAIIFRDFSYLTDIYLECDQMYNFTSVFVIIFRPKKFISIGKEFDLRKIVRDNQKDLTLITVLFNYIKGIDIDFVFGDEQFDSFKFKDRLSIGIYFSYLNFYSNQTFLDESHCNFRVFNNERNFFSHFINIKFEKTTYPNRLCPLIFRNSSAKLVVFSEIVNSLLIRNQLKFINLDVNTTNNSKNEQNRVEVFKNVDSLAYGMYGEILTLDLLGGTTNLFENIHQLSLSHVINGVENDFFQKFSVIKFIDFRLDNMKEFFHLGIKWIENLNQGIYLDLRYINVRYLK
jgi:hypothetical protein